MAKAPANADPAYLESLANYERLVASVPGLERKGAANPYTALNGNMSIGLPIRRVPRATCGSVELGKG